MDHPNDSQHPVRPVLMLAAAVAGALTAIAALNSWHVALVACGVTTAAFLAGDLVVAFRTRGRREPAVVDHDDLGPDELWPRDQMVQSSQYVGEDPFWTDRPPRARWWRRLWQRITPPCVVALMPLLILPIGLLTAPHAGADTNDGVFVDALDYLAVPYSDRAEVITLGHIVCEQLDLGMDVDTAEGAMVLGGFTPDQATAISHATIGTLCPWHAELLVDTRTALR